MTKTPAATESPLAAALTRQEAAAHLQQKFHFGTASMLAKLAMDAEGPRFYKFRGSRAVRYPIDELDRWALARIGTPQARFPKAGESTEGATRR